MKPVLSILCVSRVDHFAERFLREMATLGAALPSAEFVLCADGAWASAAAYRLGLVARHVVVESQGYIESILDEALSHTNGDYVLRLDDDESCSPAMLRWLVNQDYRQNDHWCFARQHIWPAEGWAVRTERLFPDPQTRLSIRAKAGGRSAIHAGSPFGAGVMAPVTLWHYKFFKTLEERQRIAAVYDAFHAGYGTGMMLPYSLPELAYTSDVEFCPVGDGSLPWEPTEVRCGAWS